MSNEFQKVITFTHDVEVLNGSGNVTFKADAGETMELPMASANRWLRRFKAVEGKVKVEPEKPAQAEPETEALKKSKPITADEKPADKVKPKSAPKKKTETKKQAD